MEKILKLMGVLICDLPLFTATSKTKKDDLKHVIPELLPGDIILSRDRLFPLWNAAMQLITKSRYSHSAIVINQNEVIEACSFGFGRGNVIRNSTEKHLKGYKSCCVVRPDYTNADACRSAVRFAEKQVGKPYNFSFRPTDGKSYCCTELVGDALKHAGFTFQPFKCFIGEGIRPDDFQKTGQKKPAKKNRHSLANVVIATLVFAMAPFLLMFSVHVSFFTTICIGYLALLAAGSIQYFALNDEPLQIKFHVVFQNVKFWLAKMSSAAAVEQRESTPPATVKFPIPLLAAERMQVFQPTTEKTLRDNQEK